MYTPPGTAGGLTTEGAPPEKVSPNHGGIDRSGGGAAEPILICSYGEVSIVLDVPWYKTEVDWSAN